MMLRNCLVVAVVLGGVTTAQFARAEEGLPASAAAASSAANSDGHASGVMVQARVQTQSSLLSLGVGSGFLVGYQGPSYSLGLGLGLTRVGVSSSGDSATLSLFQVAPTVTVDVWHSADGRARANLIGSVGYARASLSATVQSQTCTSDGLGGETCTNSSQDASASASLVPVMVGFGGDYFLSRNFALGAEFGLQALFLAGVSTNAGGTSRSIDAGANAQFGYGALRATFVLGD